MRKIVCLGLCAAVAAGALPFAACAPQEERSSYTIQAEYFPEERLLEATMTAEIVNTSDTAWETLKFQLWPNAYREGAKYAPVSSLYAPAAYYDGASYGGIAVSSVEGAQSFRVAGEDENILEAELSDALYPDERVTLTFAFTVSLAKINHRLGAGEHAVNLANFYPVLCHWENGFCEHVYSSNGDPFVSVCADYDVTLTVPESYVVAHTGTCDRTLQDGKAAHHVSAENVRDVAFVLSEEFRLAETSVGEIPVSYYYLNDGNAEETLACAAESLTYYGETFGAYAYGSYTVVQTDFPYGGMEYPMLSMIAADLREEEVPVVVAHETAHQWWYASVGSDQYGNAWQDEGLAEFSAALFLDAHPAYGASYEDCVTASEQSYRAYFSVNSQLTGEQNTAMQRPLTEFSGEYEYRNIAYDKGVILFDRLRDTLGDQKFFAALRAYVKENGGKIASPAELVSCFAARGAHAEGIFDSFLQGTCVI